MQNKYLKSIMPTLAFNLKRFVKSKTWIILTSIFTTVIVALYITFALLYENGVSLSIGLMTVAPNAIALIYIGTISLLITNQLFIQDKVSGIYGLEIRMGRKPGQIFLIKYLVQKIFIYGWIFADFILFLLFVPTIANFDSKFLVSMGLGIFALFLFDWLFTGIIYLFSLAKNVKLNSAFAGVMMGILIFFPLVGPAFHTFTEKIWTNQQDVPLFYYKEKTQSLINEYDQGILYYMRNDIEQIYQNSDADQEMYDGEIYYLTSNVNVKHFSVFEFLDQGIASTAKMDLLLKNQKIADKEDMETNKVNKDYWDNKSFTQKFFALIEEEFKLGIRSYDNSWFNENGAQNYLQPGQLKDFLSVIESPKFAQKLVETEAGFGLEEGKVKTELKVISNLVTEEFFNYYLLKNPVPHPGSSTNGMKPGTGFWLLLNQEEVSRQVQMNEGQRLFTRILMRSVSYADVNHVQSIYDSGYVWNLEDLNSVFEENTRTHISLSFILNPFNAIMGGSLYSGPDSFINDIKINNSYPGPWEFIKTFSAREIHINYEPSNEASPYDGIVKVTSFKPSEKLLSVEGLYLGYLLFQIVAVGITFLFNVRKPFLFKRELSDKQIEKQEKRNLRKNKNVATEA